MTAKTAASKKKRNGAEHAVPSRFAPLQGSILRLEIHLRAGRGFLPVSVPAFRRGCVISIIGRRGIQHVLRLSGVTRRIRPAGRIDPGLSGAECRRIRKIPSRKRNRPTPWQRRSCRNSPRLQIHGLAINCPVKRLRGSDRFRCIAIRHIACLHRRTCEDDHGQHSRRESELLPSHDPHSRFLHLTFLLVFRGEADIMQPTLVPIGRCVN